jgi:hypothetical protein
MRLPPPNRKMNSSQIGPRTPKRKTPKSRQIAMLTKITRIREVKSFDLSEE